MNENELELKKSFDELRIPASKLKEWLEDLGEDYMVHIDIVSKNEKGESIKKRLEFVEVFDDSENEVFQIVVKERETN